MIPQKVEAFDNATLKHPRREVSNLRTTTPQKGRATRGRETGGSRRDGTRQLAEVLPKDKVLGARDGQLGSGRQCGRTRRHVREDFRRNGSQTVELELSAEREAFTAAGCERIRE